ncbi:MAG: histidinol-phosphate transaminase [Solirubrobacteraceae bacterium]
MIEELLRDHIKGVKPYSSAREEFTGKADIYLDANESPFETEFNRYPDPLQKKLKEKIAQIKKINANQIFLSNGSDEAIDWLIRAFCEPKEDSIIICPPTFGMYEVAAKINNVNIIEIPLDHNFEPNVKEILQTKAKLLFLCSPNNPTGNQIKKEKLEIILKEFKGLVIVDEAYVDFAPFSMILEINNYANLVVLQTFSKAWGLAGLRLGATYSSRLLIDHLTKLKMPYNVGTITQKIALECLENFNLNDTVLTILTERERVSKELNTLKNVVKIYPSNGNFLLVKFKEVLNLYNYLAEKGILIRNQTKKPNCEDCLRITIGTIKENTSLLTALKNLE